MSLCGGIFITPAPNPALSNRLADTGLVPHDAREIMRVRINEKNQVRFAVHAIRELVPAQFVHSKMIGMPCCQLGATGPQIDQKVSHVRRCGRTERMDWDSIKNQKLRMGVFIPHSDGQVTMRVFAEASEVADIAKERRLLAQGV
jgi:hypothetical protein